MKHNIICIKLIKKFGKGKDDKFILQAKDIKIKQTYQLGQQGV